ncbi:MAG: helix-turn-helix transcriptional regulator [Chloroflexi bacterium]|nr:helix-turn-helix transcriptional regulator [Chloroflexota bacterium]MCI0839665.1 helix-turn-helix transcriptional regulator [Chloroflexota bacterium]MCI0883388.1 helix-turn-helix transcriptional regulator [Chloroflexota bacterium]MCI0885466.1 helix-turn-helix transcriptional regulator [Chloroflexota bacterium]
MPRKYDTQEGCPIAGTLDIIGDRWTILILRDLTLERSGKFKDLQASLRGISPNLLASRLKRLEAAGVLERSFYSQHPPRAAYQLTEKGEGLRDVVREMARWGAKYQLDDQQRADFVEAVGEGVIGPA